MREADLRRIRQLKADQEIIGAAAFYLRHRAVQEHYAGLHDKDLAMGFAALLDTLQRHLRDLPDSVRSEAVSACDAFTDRVQVEGERRRRAQAGSRGPRSPG